jgi:hypothetical protein
MVRRGGPRLASAVLVEEATNVLEQEASITALAHAVVLQLAAIAETLHRVDVEMEHLRDFGGGEHLPKLVQSHRAHPVVPFERWTVLVSRSRHLATMLALALVVEGKVGMGSGASKPYFGPVRGSTLRQASVRRSNDRAG